MAVLVGIADPHQNCRRAAAPPRPAPAEEEFDRIVRPNSTGAGTSAFRLLAVPVRQHLVADEATAQAQALQFRIHVGEPIVSMSCGTPWIGQVLRPPARATATDQRLVVAVTNPFALPSGFTTCQGVEAALREATHVPPSAPPRRAASPAFHGAWRTRGAAGGAQRRPGRRRSSSTASLRSRPSRSPAARPGAAGAAGAPSVATGAAPGGARSSDRRYAGALSGGFRRAGQGGASGHQQGRGKGRGRCGCGRHLAGHWLNSAVFAASIPGPHRLPETEGVADLSRTRCRARAAAGRRARPCASRPAPRRDRDVAETR